MSETSFLKRFFFFFSLSFFGGKLGFLLGSFFFGLSLLGGKLGFFLSFFLFCCSFTAFALFCCANTFSFKSEGAVMER